MEQICGCIHIPIDESRERLERERPPKGPRCVWEHEAAQRARVHELERARVVYARAAGGGTSGVLRASARHRRQLAALGLGLGLGSGVWILGLGVVF